MIRPKSLNLDDLSLKSGFQTSPQHLVDQVLQR